MTWVKRSGNLRFSIFIIAFLIPGSVFFSLAELEVHNFGDRCNMCHLVDEDKNVFEDIFLKDIDSLCKECHSDLGLSHPTGMRPAMEMPKGFPLDSAGRLTCATCHGIHGEGPYLLNWKESGRIFCFLCHGENIENLHADAGETAHSSGRYVIIDESISIDNLSMQCMSCHDSSIADDISVGLGRGAYINEHGGKHPIGVDFMEAYAKGGYTHPSKLAKNIRLFNGKVGCGSCHNTYSKEPYQLAISNEGSALCLACHRK
ncbi:MAG TPA: hypothetical protein ENH31_04750 [Nitrospirae bacterium]|nr:cytochrome c nitrite reductase pentaheme subunit [bacterium BMS3Abin10]GBE39581.1 cytochrome c nitrite reductase pentaheme subunit [bacterium BMS3Bbin08]HDH51663.1 hypothetical protein [Nitrospirota bacterium]HDK17758.1 hypothetical protein [Nitrospirota bacterium]HDK81863.1 hypothetical protein [Nitrospirota bacterium]